MEAEVDIKPNRRLRLEVPSEKIFWERVQRPDGCWLYDGAKEINGYGYLQNPFGDKPKFITAHRAAWIYTHGPIPEGMRVCHICDIRSCINPAHLFLGTDKDNAADKMRKGRSNSMTRAKLTEDQVRYIKANYRKTASRMGNGSALARQFGVTPGVVHCIGRGDTWKHIK